MAWRRVSGAHARAGLVAALLLVVGCGGGVEDAGVDDAASALGDGGTASGDGASVGDDAAPALADAGAPGLVDGASGDGAPAPADAGVPVAVDAAAVDGSLDGGAATSPAQYTSDRTYSPINAGVAASLRAIAGRGADLDARVFAKIGDSLTVSTNFLHCFAGTHVDLAGRTYLEPALAHFRMGRAGTTTPFDRTSLAATVGWSARSAIAGSPSPIEREVAAILPRFAVVMFGTNDTQARDVDRYAMDMWSITDGLIARGVIPLMSSIPPRGDSAVYDEWVPRYNAIARGLAQGRQVPFMDWHKELLPLPNQGLGGDRLHASVYFPNEGVRACVFDATGLRYGYNVRNLLVLETLARAKAAVVDGAAPPDAQAATLEGAGTMASPFAIRALPFSDLRDSSGGTRAVDRYPGCNAAQDESGPEHVYRLELTRAATVRAMVFDRGATDIDLHLLGAGASCLMRNDRLIVADLQPGTYHFVLDTYVSGGVEHGGEYLFVLLEE